MIAQKQTVYKEDQANRKMNVKREFEAPLDKVWKAWTTSEILDKWWAPKPWKAVTKKMDFREGGKWEYYMQGPEGEKHYCICEYKTVDPRKSFTGLDAFTDENGNINKDMPRSEWFVHFRENEGVTTVEVDITFESEEAMKKTVEMGFKDGFAAAHNNLDEIL